MRYNNKVFNLKNNLNLDLDNKIDWVRIEYGKDTLSYFIGKKEYCFTFDELRKGEITIERFK